VNWSTISFDGSRLAADDHLLAQLI